MQLSLPHNTSVLVYQDAKNLPRAVEVVRGVRAMPLALALCRIQPVFFENQQLNAEIALRALKSVDDLVRVILETGSSALAARFAGAYEFLGDKERADQITRTVQAVGMTVEPKNPFAKAAPVFEGPRRLASPYAGRIEALFCTLREPVLEAFKDIPPRPVSEPESYLEHLEAIYTHDAYNSLSIEGYSHPYKDGNGRLARFLMNLMMASGGYPWTIVRNTRRREYLDALEGASAEQNILPFAKFIREEMSVDWSKSHSGALGSDAR